MLRENRGWGGGAAGLPGGLRPHLEQGDGDSRGHSALGVWPPARVGPRLGDSDRQGQRYLAPPGPPASSPEHRRPPCHPLPASYPGVVLTAPTASYPRVVLACPPASSLGVVLRAPTASLPGLQHFLDFLL